MRIFLEKITGTRRDRLEVAQILDHLRAGNVVTVTQLDRLARSTRALPDIAASMQAAGTGLHSSWGGSPSRPVFSLGQTHRCIANLRFHADF